MKYRLVTIVRISLWVTAPFNFLAAYAFCLPHSGLGQVLGFPQPVHPLYTYFSGAMVGLFGCAYLWLALQRNINNALLFVGACGKTLAVCICSGLYLQGNLAMSLALVVSGDAVFAGLWFYYLYHQRNAAAA